MGKKSGAKKQAKCNRQPTNALQQAKERLTASEEDLQIDSMCRAYVASFQPLTEIKEENRRLKRAIIPPRFCVLMDRYAKPLYLELLDNIRKRIADLPLFMSFSFSCNGNCSYSDNVDHIEVINVIVGTLEAGHRGNMFIVNCVQNTTSIGKCEDDDDNDESNSDFFIKLFNDTLVSFFRYLWFLQINA